MKIRGYVKLLLVISFVFGQAFAADGVSSNNNNLDKAIAKSATSSKGILLEAMDDPVIKQVFHKTQLEILQTPADKIIYDYFAMSPVYAPLYQFLIKNNDALVGSFELSAKSNMLRAARGLTPQYDLIDKLVVDVASSLGFTKEAIENRQIFILGGDENAFTVSGSQKKIIVAFQRGILRTMSRTEIAGVLAHELGHIRAEHTVKGIMNSIMLQVVGELFVNGKLSATQGGADFTSFESLDLSHVTCSGMCSHSQNIVKQSDAMSREGLSTPQKFVDEAIQQFVANLSGLPKVELQYTVQNYLNVLLQVAVIERAPIATIKYIQTLANNVENIGIFKVNIQEFMKHATLIKYAVSRAKEKTADQISASTVRNEHLASAFAKLIGLDFDKEFRPKIFNQIKKQAEELLAETPESLYPMIMGSTHPSLILRINNMLTFSAYPSILFANNYLRLLLLNDAMQMAKENAKRDVELIAFQIQEARKNLEVKIAEAVAAGKATSEQVTATRESYEKKWASVLNNTKKYSDDANKSADKYQSQVLELLFSSQFPVTGIRAPRMDNTIQYVSVTKQTLIESAKVLSEKLKDYEGKELNERQELEAEQIRTTLSGVERSLEAQTTFLLKIKNRLQKMQASATSKDLERLRKRNMIVDRVIAANNSQDLEKIREKVTKINPSLREDAVYRRNKIPVSLSTEPAGSPICSKLFN